MSDILAPNPAEVAAQRALDEVFHCIHEKKSFLLEAGAGAGKTYSLVKALQLIIEVDGVQLLRRHQRVACITYTNVATDEVTKRTDGHPAVYASTIHSFCWELCKGFQAVVRSEVINIAPLAEKLSEVGEIGGRRIGYELGHRRVTDTEILLHHDDVLKIMVALMERPKFRRIFAARFPVLFIDEYQDTDANFAISIIEKFVQTGDGPLVGLFGDSWQKIYRTGAGHLEHPNLQLIGKEANFRSAPDIVDVLNRIRPELPQQVSDPQAVGSASVFHSNGFAGTRRTGGHWGGDLPADDVHRYLSSLRSKLTTTGWDFSPDKTKILMLTHNVLAAEQCYSQILGVFEYNDSLLKKEDPHIAFLVDTVEPVCAAFSAGRFGDMFSVIGRKARYISTLAEKREWSRDIRRLVEIRTEATIGEVIDLLKTTRKPHLPNAVLRTERLLGQGTREEIDASRTLSQIEKLRSIPYSELIALADFINDHTPFSTKHGVKGAQFDNVLVVLGRGWNQYNWTQFLEWFPNRYSSSKENTYVRNRNLFYVACSRPKKNLALLFTQVLTQEALHTLEGLFGSENICSFRP
ncbi:UvrD-helicase domain-containing protein [Algisphaera agarilytica]|uniref:DNA helicase-2/ATP-dependent DNA helicase PcrA n=1 Tax=Algisphaera agarilytica TaxID=1385975 RepID=A0A7X0H486_9BACT|nr:UvrD-helicase domain-containing protein [Algisphaera agarilytica]MBB6428981.1 DNA helicase-2/ATP-dependent DNA helicase PcrA [Algisphaera agarilytica]